MQPTGWIQAVAALMVLHVGLSSTHSHVVARTVLPPTRAPASTQLLAGLFPAWLKLAGWCCAPLTSTRSGPAEASSPPRAVQQRQEEELPLELR